jgi:tripartite-type tricarboxylate transporter receptor subunit TctC
LRILPAFLKTLGPAAAAVSLLLGAGVCTAHAQTAKDYPTQPVKFIVPYPSGGATDAIARVVAKNLSESWGKPVVVENRPGASGNIGSDQVAKSPADGHTVLVTITAMIQAPYLYAKMPFDPFTAFTPVTLAAHSTDIFVVANSVPANTVKEFVALVKADPKKYNYGSYGNATSSHIHGEMFKSQADINLLHIPYKGAAPLMNDILGGQLTAAFVDATTARPHLRSGKFKVLASTGSNRLKMMPEIPTFTELGYKSFEPYGWAAIFVPSATPPDIVAKLSGEIVRILRQPEITKQVDDMGLQTAAIPAQEFATVLKRDSAVWGKVIKEANIRIEQ